MVRLLVFFFFFGDGLSCWLWLLCYPIGETENGSRKRFQRVEILKIAEPCPLIDPSQVLVTQGEILVADPVLTPIGTWNSDYFGVLMLHATFLLYAVNFQTSSNMIFLANYRKNPKKRPGSGQSPWGETSPRGRILPASLRRWAERYNRQFSFGGHDSPIDDDDIGLHRRRWRWTGCPRSFAGRLSTRSVRSSTQNASSLRYYYK